MTQNNNDNGNNTKYQNNRNSKPNNNNNNKQGAVQKKEKNQHANYQKGGRNEFHKRTNQRYNPENRTARIANPKREESVEDIKMDIEKLEKDIQFEIKQIQSIKLGL